MSLELVVGERQHISDLACPARESDEAIDTERVSGARGEPLLERLEKAFVDRIRGKATRRTNREVREKARTLLDGIGQFAESVAELDASHVELEALGDAWILRLLSRQRGLRGGVLSE